MKSVLVLGNARSGTSMTAGMLSILGVDFNETKKPLKCPEQNPKGTFENPNFIDITSKMHQEYKNGKTLKYVQQRYHARLQEIIKSHERELWGFKSAVTHHFLNIIIPMLQNPHIVVVVRSLLHNAQSWQVHMKDVYGTEVTLEHALENMSKSQEKLMRNSLLAQCPKMFTSYEGIKSNPLKEARHMGEFIGVDPEPKKEDILEFIMPNYSTLNSS